MADKIKFALALLLVVAGLAGFYLLSDQATIFRVLSVLAGVLLGAVVAWRTEPGQRFFGFAQEAWVETKKVVWPNKKETIQTTGAVFAFAVVMALFLWIVDSLLQYGLYDLILGRPS